MAQSKKYFLADNLLKKNLNNFKNANKNENLHEGEQNDENGEY